MKKGSQTLPKTFSKSAAIACGAGFLYGTAKIVDGKVFENNFGFSKTVATNRGFLGIYRCRDGCFALKSRRGDLFFGAIRKKGFTNPSFYAILMVAKQKNNLKG
ncbi:MAG: hypothetical protein IJX47_04275 [Clostridia bacterium]|nr:hypothetical protein [Clostridia bacterium]